MFKLQNLFENSIALIYLSYVSKEKTLSFLIGILPISYIFGTFIVNINILLVILGGLILYIKGNKIKITNIDSLIILFFIYILFTSIYNTIEINSLKQNGKADYYILNKSLFFLRYILLYFSIRIFIENKLLNFKLIFYMFSSAVIFVIFDVILQFFIGKDIFGFVSPYAHKNTGPFYDEAIAGGYIQRFSLFIFFSFIAYSTMKNTSSKIYILSLFFFITVISIIFSGNRMPLMLFMLSIFLILITNKTLKQYLLQILIFMFVISLITISSNSRLKQYYKTFYDQSEKIISLYSYRITGIGSDLPHNMKPNYIYEFDAGISTFKLNKFIGGGIKSFRFNCPKRKITNRERTTCNMHPHNYFLEILTDLGIVGFLIFIALIILVLFKAYKILINMNNKYIFSPFFYVFLMEVFPLRSSGSFFTTNNSVIIFLSLGVIVSIISIDRKSGGPTGNRTPIR